MNYGAIAAFGVFMISLATVLLITPHSVFADSYEESQAIYQSNRMIVRHYALSPSSFCYKNI
jgi:hypothetical protein